MFDWDDKAISRHQPLLLEGEDFSAEQIQEWAHFWRAASFGTRHCVCGGPSRRCQNPPSPSLWRTRWKDGMRKSGWGRTSPRPCWCTPRQFCATGANETHSWTCNPYSQLSYRNASWVIEDSLWDHEWITETSHHERKFHLQRHSFPLIFFDHCSCFNSTVFVNIS